MENLQLVLLSFHKKKEFLDSFRAKFLIESVNCLKDELKKINITLLVAIEKPEKLISKIIDDYKINRIYLQEEWTDEEINEEKFLNKKNINLFKFNDQFLYHPQDVDLEKISNVFTNFRKYCEKKLDVRASYKLSFSMPKNNLLRNDFNVPSLKDLGLDSFTQIAFGMFRYNHLIWNEPNTNPFW